MMTMYYVVPSNGGQRLERWNCTFGLLNIVEYRAILLPIYDNFLNILWRCNYYFCLYCDVILVVFMPQYYCDRATILLWNIDNILLNNLQYYFWTTTIKYVLIVWYLLTLYMNGHCVSDPLLLRPNCHYITYHL